MGSSISKPKTHALSTNPPNQLPPSTNPNRHRPSSDLPSKNLISVSTITKSSSASPILTTTLPSITAPQPSMITVAHDYYTSPSPPSSPHSNTSNSSPPSSTTSTSTSTLPVRLSLAIPSCLAILRASDPSFEQKRFAELTQRLQHTQQENAAKTQQVHALETSVARITENQRQSEQESSNRVLDLQAQLHKASSEKHAEQTALAAEITNLQRTVLEANEAMQQRDLERQEDDRLICELQDELHALTSQHEAHSANQDDRISALQATVAQLDAELHRTAQETDQYIQDLEAELDNAALEPLVASKDAQIAELQATIQAKDALFERLNEVTKDLHILRRAESRSHGKELDKLSQIIKEKDEWLVGMQEALKQQRQEVVQERDAWMERVKELEEMVEGKEVWIEALDDVIDGLNQDREALKGKVEGLLNPGCDGLRTVGCDTV